MRLNSERETESYFLVGGAGFIGSHFCDWLMGHEKMPKLTIYDNFSSGRKWHFEHHLNDVRFNVIEGDVKELDKLIDSMRDHDTVIHFASNPDISKAVEQPDIDFQEGTLLTNNVVEAMRISGAKRILYTSGSGVYGDLGTIEANEDHGPMIPISTYGASKLAGETLISSYCHMFDKSACVFRFGNVVGPRQTHGVGYDFAKRLMVNPNELAILGDGTQSKSYVHVNDVIQAVFTAHNSSVKSFDVFNVATGDYITVEQIADIAAECLDLKPETVEYKFAGGDRGWKGDIPIVRLSTEKIQKLGWQCQMSSAQAIKSSICSMLEDIKQDRI